MKPTLLVLAAGLGSRYGGLKQLDTIGPNGEIIMDYAIHDALKAGFGSVVLIVQEQMIPILKERYRLQPVSFVVQDKQIIINNTVYQNNKPWGTAHALWCARNAIKSNFLLINADDFYGQNSYSLAYNHLSKFQNPCAIVFPILKTLSENGKVNRAEIKIKNEFVIDSIERENIRKTDNGIVYTNLDGENIKLESSILVSMNMWGFTPIVFDYIENDLKNFIEKWQLDNRLEYQLPSVVTSMINKKLMQVKVIPTNEEWIGVTYQEDKEIAIVQLKKLHDLGLYK
ncbi:sugar phosphate nucleotidyltransferase [Flavobacterium sp.]|uniref:sugar phosphate nucleotidyltransferase n=1 Tax=Flavobacterium sp. TaxID=239 RepID=UPI000EE9B867|nr:sugar phosphate nucleotidyltransferase [Flavobacterium sp.]HCQ13121.1 nucleotidyltransferase [Flavobacterium sp.]